MTETTPKRPSRLSAPVKVGLMIVAAWVLLDFVRNPKTETGDPAGKPAVELISSRSERSSDAYMTVMGEVRNISSVAIERARARVTWRNQAGALVRFDEAMIEYDPLLPGQTSPFKVLSGYNPEMDKFSVEIIRRGEVLPTGTAPAPFDLSAEIKLTTDDTRKKYLLGVAAKCQVVTTFFQGVSLAGYDVYNVDCGTGRTFSVTLAPPTPEAITCAAAKVVTGMVCFVPFAAQRK